PNRAAIEANRQPMPDAARSKELVGQIAKGIAVSDLEMAQAETYARQQLRAAQLPAEKNGWSSIAAFVQQLRKKRAGQSAPPGDRARVAGDDDNAMAVEPSGRVFGAQSGPFILSHTLRRALQI